MDVALEKLGKVLDDQDSFFMKVRFLDGVDPVKLNDVLAALKEVELFYKNTDLVPKRLYFLIFGVESILWSMLDSYLEPVQQQIFEAISKIDNALKACFYDVDINY